jgi:hypothetical protein
MPLLTTSATSKYVCGLQRERNGLASARTSGAWVRPDAGPSPPLALYMKKKKNRYAKPIVRLHASFLHSSYKTRPASHVHGIYLPPTSLPPKPIPSVPASLSSTPRATTRPASHVHGIYPPPTSSAYSTSNPPIASSPLHSVQHQLQQQKKQAIEIMKEHMM